MKLLRLLALVAIIAAATFFAGFVVGSSMSPLAAADAAVATSGVIHG